MQCGEDTVDQAIADIAALLTAAYRRRASIRLVRAEIEPPPSTERLAISGVQRQLAFARGARQTVRPSPRRAMGPGRKDDGWEFGGRCFGSVLWFRPYFQ